MGHLGIDAGFRGSKFLTQERLFFLNDSAWLEDSAEKEISHAVPMALNERRNSPSANAAFGKEMVLLSFKRATVCLQLLHLHLDTPVGLFGYPFPSFHNDRGIGQTRDYLWRSK